MVTASSVPVLDILTAGGAIATPLLVLLLGGIGWKFRSKLERRFELEDRLREDRIEAYNALLEPFIILFMTEAAWKSDSKNKGKDKNKFATTKLLSLDYRKQSFKMALVGSDSVVSSYNELMQYFYSHEVADENDSEANKVERMNNILSLIGSFLLEIRKSMGNEVTKLDNWDMLEWFITDARSYRKMAK